MEETLGRRIGVMRRKRGMTQEYLAGALGVSPQAVSKWENDQNAPDVGMLVKLADVLEVTTDYLLTGDKAPRVTWAPDREEAPRAKVIRIEVTGQDGKVTNVRVPFALCKAMGKMSVNIQDTVSGANKLNVEDIEQILLLANQGVLGLLMEVDARDGEQVRIFVE